MDLLFSVPYLARIVLSLFAILIFQKLTKRLDLAMAAGIVLLALWTGHSAASMARVAGARVASLDMLFLAFVIAGIIWLSSLMSHAGVMKELVVSLRSRLPKRAILAALPAVVGLLPMPAGALFSCPLVDDADDARELDPDLKTRINYWFRHVWEFWWPLYPGVLLAIDMSALPIWKFTLLMFPLFFAAIAAGYVFLLRKAPAAGPAPRGERDAPFLPLILPILTVIAVYALVLVFIPGVGRFNKYLPMAVGVLCSLVVMQLQRPAPFGTWKRVVLSWKSFSLVLLIVLARVYGAFVEARLPDGSSLMENVRAELDAYGIPAMALIVVVPFISGITTGITVGYIGASFPVVLSLAGTDTAGLFATIVLGYASGFVGMMLSPIHICLIVTNDYFKTGMASSLYGLLRPAAMLFLGAVAYSFLWRWLA